MLLCAAVGLSFPMGSGLCAARVQMLLHHSTGMPLHFNDNTFADLPGLPRFNADGSASSSTRGGKAYDDSGMAAEFLFELEVVEAALQDATMELEVRARRTERARGETLKWRLCRRVRASSLCWCLGDGYKTIPGFSSETRMVGLVLVQHPYQLGFSGSESAPGFRLERGCATRATKREGLGVFGFRVEDVY